MAFIADLRKDSDRAIALVIVAQLEVVLQKTIVEKFQNKLSETQQHEMFGERGPLSTLGAKIRIGFAIGLYGPVVTRDLTIISKVRNAFAHSALLITFADKLITKNCQHLEFMKIPENFMYNRDNLYRANTSGRQKIVESLSAKDKFIQSVLALSVELSYLGLTIRKSRLKWTEDRLAVLTAFAPGDAAPDAAQYGDPETNLP